MDNDIEISVVSNPIAQNDDDDDISRWNVGRVENMDCTFLLAKSFNQDLLRWNKEV